MGRGCGEAGKAVASDTRDLQIESGHRQQFSNSIVAYICRKDKINEKEVRNPPLIKVGQVGQIESPNPPEIIKCYFILALHHQAIVLSVIKQMADIVTF